MTDNALTLMAQNPETQARRINEKGLETTPTSSRTLDT